MGEKLWKDDPTATYRGFRRQALYCLHRLFDDGFSADWILQPEGNEDLAIYDRSGKLIEIVQVKDLSDNLTVSKFKPSFYKRILEHCLPNSDVQVQIASFGPIGQEILAAVDPDKATPSRALETLTKDRNSEVEDEKGQLHGTLSMEEALRIFAHLKIQQVCEDVLTSSVIAKLRDTATAGDPERAFENLMWWLTTSAEKRQMLTRSSVVEKLNNIGKFLSHLAAHHQEWNTSIIPLSAFDNATWDQSRLEAEFFRGGRVRIEHVAAGLDVRRTTLLESIHRSFESEQVSIVRGASGQGKTTLGYRYVLDFAPKDFRFEVLKVSDIQHARRMANAIRAHAAALEVPILVYVDVRPSDALWKELVRELFIPGVRVLVTIREEDWYRSRVSQDDFRFIETVMEFDEVTAQEIYSNLEHRVHTNAHLDFSDAWSHLGARKTLFEFVYLITQEEVLAEKIKLQVQTLQADVNSNKLLAGELKLLRLVSVASAFEARVTTKQLIAACGIPEPSLTLARFNDEFLLRTTENESLVEGYHAIRSKLICDELIDETLTPWRDIAVDLVHMLHEPDIETFLLCAFARKPDSRDALVKVLNKTFPNTWVGIRSICVALMWLGLDVYASENRALVENVRTVFGSGWWFVLDWDIAQIQEPGGFRIFEAVKGTSLELKLAADAVPVVQRQQTDKDTVFKYVRNWLQRLPEPSSALISTVEVVACSEVLYWAGHLEIDTRLSKWVTTDRLDEALEKLPISLFSEFAAAANVAADRTYATWFASRRSRVLTAIRRQCQIVALVESAESLTAHYLIDVDIKASAVSKRRPGSPDDVSINDLSVERVEVLSRCVPGFKSYGAKAYGHRNSFFPDLPDDSEKNIPAERILPPWLPAFNAVGRCLIENRFRPKTWSDFFTGIRCIREQVVAVFTQLQNGIADSRGNAPFTTQAVDLWNECESAVNSDFLMPVSAVDEWGFISESRTIGQQSVRVERYSSFSRVQALSKALNKYTGALGRFMKQTSDSLILIPALKLANTKQKRAVALSTAKSMGITEVSARLSVFNGIEACGALEDLHRCESNLFHKLSLALPQDGFTHTELDTLVETMRVWCKYAHPSEFEVRRERGTSRSTLRTLSDCLRPTLNRLRDALRSLGRDTQAKILTASIRWKGERAIWITYDSTHPLGSLESFEQVCRAIFAAIQPDTNKIVRSNLINYYWQRIIIVPLVLGKSLEMNALPNIRLALSSPNPDFQNLSWQFFPEQIPAESWEKLGLDYWEPESNWEFINHFTSAYSSLFYHVDHMADFNRCEIDLDDEGTQILVDYLARESSRMQPLLQETVDSCVRVIANMPELSDSIVTSRPNIAACAACLVEMRECIVPTDQEGNEFCMSMSEFAEWRDRLRTGFNLIGLVRNLWMADSLGLSGYVL